MYHHFVGCVIFVSRCIEPVNKCPSHIVEYNAKGGWLMSHTFEKSSRSGFGGDTYVVSIPKLLEILYVSDTLD